MTGESQTTTVERDYADDQTSARRSLGSTLSPNFLFLGEPAVPRRQPKRRARATTQAWAQAPLGCISASMRSAVLVFAPGLTRVMDEFPGSFEGQGSASRQPLTAPRRHERYARLVSLIQSWLADDSDYDETVWPQVKSGIEESRTSFRNRFSE